MTTQQIAAKRVKLEATLTAVAGTNIEITVRDDKAFTFTWDGPEGTVKAKLIEFFGGLATVEEFVYDEECEASFLYIHF